MKLFWGRYGRIVGLAALVFTTHAADSSGTIDLTVTNGNKSLDLPLVPGVDEFKVLATTNLAQPFSLTPGTISGYNWSQPGAQGMGFFTVQMTPKDSNAVVSASLLNRLAYGQTPDELERLSQIGPQAYINEQLAPEKIQEDLAIDRANSSTDWQFFSVTGTENTNDLFIYLTATGTNDCYIDDIKIVEGTVAENGTNFVQNGDFENGLAGWIVPDNLINSAVVTDVKHSGNASLHLVSTAAGSTTTNVIHRSDLGLKPPNTQTYTLSYWYKPGSKKGATLTVRMADTAHAKVPMTSSPADLPTRLALGIASLSDLDAWHIMHAVQSKRQLLEVLLQFFENHFVTQQSKSSDYMDGFNLLDDAAPDQIATNFEYREHEKWRLALLNPQCTFYDLLKISAESPAMIIYLDTVASKGNGSNIANENYARELMELFTFGVDNGYDQNDITVMSRAWTGWTLRLVDPGNESNPFAPQTTTLLPGQTNISQIDNLDGVWTFGYKPTVHNNREKVIFPGKVVPARFGPPYAGRNYELKLPAGGSTNWQYVTLSGTASSSTLYMYLTGTGDCYLDDIKIVSGTLPEAGVNTVKNGDFESGLTGWTVASNLSGSSVVNDVTHSGAGALHLVSTAAGTSLSTSISRKDLGLTNGQPYTLSYWYLPGSTMAGDLVVRLSGSGLNSTPPASTNTIQDGYSVIAHLANQPFTQEFISVKLCRLFVHDDFATGYDFTDPNLSPEGRLVRDCMRAWEENQPKGQIRKVLEVIFNSDLFRSQAGVMQKVKTPLEFTVSAVRALRAAVGDGTYTADTDGYSIISPLNRMGRMLLFNRDTPDGYPEAGAPWISGGTLAERLRFVQALLLPVGTSGKTDAGNCVSDPVKLLKLKLPQTSWHDSAAVASYFASILYPAEGKANLDQYRTEAMHYLDTADDGVTSSLFSALGDTTTTYDLRVRGMVAMLMTFQRFQEQ